jgi:hypothetical protein
MPLSQFIHDILDLALDEYPSGNLLRKQIPLLRVIEQAHTGSGIFIYFSADPEITQYQLQSLGDYHEISSSDSTEMIDGVEIRIPVLGILADAVIHLKNGFISHLEIWNKCGEEYPVKEPEQYELHQIWNIENRRSIIR